MPLGEAYQFDITPGALPEEASDNEAPRPAQPTLPTSTWEESP